jgi:hypothetical protein
MKTGRNISRGRIGHGVGLGSYSKGLARHGVLAFFLAGRATPDEWSQAVTAGACLAAGSTCRVELTGHTYLLVPHLHIYRDPSGETHVTSVHCLPDDSTCPRTLKPTPPRSHCCSGPQSWQRVPGARAPGSSQTQPKPPAHSATQPCHNIYRTDTNRESPAQQITVSHRLRDDPSCHYTKLIGNLIHFRTDDRPNSARNAPN